MRPMFILTVSIILVSVSFTAIAKTPRDVYGQVDLLIKDIELLRTKKNITQDARKPGIQIAKTPLHVYTKGLEVLEKVNRYRSLNGLPQKAGYSLPAQNVTPAEVYALVKEIRTQLQSSRLDAIPDDSIPQGITPSDVYEHIWYASYLMDGLSGAIKPALVYRNASRIIESLSSIARKLNKSPVQKPEQVPQNKKPADVNIEAYKVFYKVVQLSKSVGIPPSRVPSFPAGQITPSDVYDTTNNILTELTRISIKLGLSPPPNMPLPEQTISPNNVYANMLVISDYLDQLN